MAVTIYDIYNALGFTEENGTATLINAIRNNLAGLSNDPAITEVWDGTNAGLSQFGVAVNAMKVTQNAFINELVDRIGLVVLERISLENSLKLFKKGRMEFGRTVQEVATDIIKAESFNPQDAESTVFKRTQPNTRVLFHDNWRKEVYPATIENDELMHAFTTVDRFESFIVQIYDSLYNSNEVDEFVWTMTLAENYVGKGFATYVETTAVTDQTTATAFIKSVRSTFRKMTLSQGSRAYNNMGIHTRTRPENIYLIMTADLEAEVDVDVLANAFNIDYTTLKARTLIVDSFAITGLQAILCDERIFKIYDKVFSTESIRNPRGRYWNIFLHVHQLFSMSRFQNFVAFMSEGIPAVTRLTLAPMAKITNVGSTVNFRGIIQSVDDQTTLTASLLDASQTAISGVTPTISFISGDSSSGVYNVAVSLPSNAALNNTSATLVVTATPDTGSPQTQTAILEILPATTARTDAKTQANASLLP